MPGKPRLRVAEKRWGARVIASIFLTVCLLPSFAGLGYASSLNGGGVVAGGFEIDGDFDFDHLTGATSDWANVTTTMGTDAANSATDDSFKEGAKEQGPDGWVIEPHSVPGKDDLTRIYAATNITPSVAFLYLGFERVGEPGKGDVHVNFELNKKTSSIINSKGETIPERTDGDVLVVYDYDGGQKAAVIEVRLWNGIADDPSTSRNEEALFGTWDLISAPAWGDVNFDGPITRPSGAPFGGGTVDTLRFGEAAVDLTGVPGILACPGLSQFWAKSRSSGESFDSALKDYVGPVPLNVSTCGSIKVLKKDDSNNPLDGATFELFNDVDHNGVKTSTDTTTGRTCTTGDDPATAAVETGTCTFGSVAPGDYLVVETAAPSGYVLDPFVAAVTVLRRQDVTVSHVFIDPKIQYRLTLTPATDTNLVNNNHVFTSLLEKSLDSGTTWVAAANEAVSFSLAGRGSILSIAPSGPNGSSCTTTAAGECTITISSGITGLSTLTASFNKTTATTPVAISQSAIKNWVNYRISLLPEATNLIGTTHTFTALLEKSTNDGTWAAVQGAAVTPTIQSGPGSIVGSTCAATSATGTCTISITSATPGDTVVQAAYGAVEGNTSATFTATQVKHWVNFRVTVAPNGVNLIGQPHTFTVTVQKNSGSGFVALPGVHVTLGWAGVKGSSITGGTCVSGTTSSSGTCTVIVNSTAAGSGTLTATYDTVLDSGPASFSGSATKSWVGYTLTVTPETDLNLLPAEPTHTFTVTLGSTDPTLAPVAGQTVDLALTSSVATITAVGAGGTIDSDGLGGTCVTTSTGTCSIVITTTGPGVATLEASYKTVVSSVNVNISDTGDKTWITYRINVTPETATNLVGNAHTFTVKIESTTNGTSWSPVVGVHPTVGISGVGSITGGTCIPTTGLTDAQGECTVIVDSATTGVSTITATYLATVGTASSSFTDSSTKTWINYQVVVSPQTAVNLVNNDHVFTITVLKDSGDGKGFQPLAGATPTATVTGVGSITSNTCAAGTLTDGTCLVTITSASPGTSSLTASYLGTADTDSAIFTATAVKNWVNYRIAVSPKTADNPVGTTHTFTILLEKDTGSGFAPVGGETIAIDLSGLGTIIDIPGGTIASGGRGGTCTTSIVTATLGTCTATITSATAGTSRLTATFLAVVGTTSGTFSDFGDKNWIPNPSIAIVKTANPISGAPGDTVTYTYVVTNTGPLDLFDISVDDDKLGHIGDIAFLAAGQTAAPLTAQTTLGSIGVTNVGTATGHDRFNRIVRASDDATVSVVLPLRIERVLPAVLPRTGTDPTVPLGIAMSMILMGATFSWLGRRRVLAANQLS